MLPVASAHHEVMMLYVTQLSGFTVESNYTLPISYGLHPLDNAHACPEAVVHLALALPSWRAPMSSVHEITLKQTYTQQFKHCTV